MSTLITKTPISSETQSPLGVPVLGGARRAFVNRHIWIALVLVLAAFLRLNDLGAGYFDGDDAFISIRALQVAREHALVLVGPPMAVGLWHSPVSVYLYAIPYSLSLDPRVARAFTALLNVTAIAVLYLVGVKYFNRAGTLAGALLLAVHPYMVASSRDINNAQLGALFVALYLLTGFMGCVDGTRVARWLHLLMLSLAGQCHPHTFAIAPVSLILLADAWIRGRRRYLLADFLGGGLLALASLAPYAIGLLQLLPTANLPAAAVTAFSNKGVMFLADMLSWRLSEGAPQSLTLVLPLLLLGGIAISALRARGLALLVAVGSMPLVATAFNIHLVIDYFWSTLPVAFLLMGVCLGVLFEQRWLRWVGFGLVGAIAISNLNYLVRLDRRDDVISLDQQMIATDQALATNKPVLVLSDGNYDNLMRWELHSLRANLLGRDVRVVAGSRSMPLPAAGATLLGSTDFGLRPLFAGGEVVKQYFRFAPMAAAAQFSPNIPLRAPQRFDGGQTVLGFFGTAPATGGPAKLNLIWRVDQVSPVEFGVFSQLVDERGAKLSQVDQAGLPVAQQRVGELVLNQLDFTDVPKVGPLFIRFGFIAADGHRSNRLSAGGAIVEGDAFAQVRGFALPVMEFNRALTLEDIRLNAPTQGEQLVVDATWRLKEALDNQCLRLLVIDKQSGQMVYETATVLAAGEWVVGAFVSEQYVLRVPTDLHAGAYVVEAHLACDPGAVKAVKWADGVVIAARNRKFVRPGMAHELQEVFSDKIGLAGYDLQLAGRTLSVTLHWQALRQLEHSYKYFVHVLRNGELAAQWDAIPQDAEYPTLWWARNEFVSQAVQLDLAALAAGEYTVTTGFYDATTEQRLAAPVTLQGIRLP
jgi:hypothetical protein